MNADPGDRDPRADEDERWREIVRNFGDRAQLPDGDLGEHPSSAEAREDTGEPEDADEPEDPVPTRERLSAFFGSPQGPAELEDIDDAEHDPFIPPDPPPVPRPEGIRLVAWSGLFGVPTLLLVLLVLGIRLPGLLNFGLFAWFVGGFGYLVATMDRTPDDGWDDGAVL